MTMEEFLQVGRWLIALFRQLWEFLGTAGFIGFAVIGLFILKKLVSLFRKLII